MDPPKGLELLFNIYKKELSCKEDFVVLIIHSLFIRKLGLLAGLGDEWPEGEAVTELLPTGWNINKELYTLRYHGFHGSKKYLVKATKSGDDLLFTFLEKTSKDVQCLTFGINDYVRDNIKDFPKAYQNLSDVSKKFDGIVDYFQPKHMSENVKEKSQADTQEFTYLTSTRNQPSVLKQNRNYFNDPMPMVGQADLNPFDGGMGGGMLFDHQRNPRGSFPNPHFPRGAIPPGARFDPIAPGFGSRNYKPDPDHLEPPGYSDMFM